MKIINTIVSCIFSLWYNISKNCDRLLQICQKCVMYPKRSRRERSGVIKGYPIGLDPPPEILKRLFILYIHIPI